jgi:hypothetical protein
MTVFACGHPKTPENSWHKDRNKKTGKQYYGCKICIGARNIQRYQANPEEKKQRDHQYYIDNREAIKERVRVYQTDRQRYAAQKLKSLQKRLRKLSAKFTERECWLWNGATDDKGYGRYFGADHPHRVAYELWIGPIPGGFEIHHQCLIENCFNPTHLKCLTPEQHHKLHHQLKKAS